MTTPGPEYESDTPPAGIALPWKTGGLPEVPSGEFTAEALSVMASYKVEPLTGGRSLEGALVVPENKTDVLIAAMTRLVGTGMALYAAIETLQVAPQAHIGAGWTVAMVFVQLGLGAAFAAPRQLVKKARDLHRPE